jgi:voltage-gated potassium channel
MLVVLSTLIYVVERDGQPQAFASIPQAMWWTMVTLTTVGYGDVVPATAFGRIIGGMTMITGILMVALPTGVVVTGFADEVRKRNFVVNWKLVSKVPLFANLDAAQIAEVVSLLTPIVVPANQAVVRVGEDASSMYFVVSGRLEVQMHPQPVYLETGDFFGEMGIIEARRRSASIIALTECNLLELKAENFHKLCKNHETIKASVDIVVEARKRQLVQIGDREEI